MAPGKTIVEVASSIYVNTQRVEDFFNAKGLQSPSFDVTTPVTLQLPEDVSSSREAVIEAMDELHTLLLGPLQFLTSLYVRLNIPSLSIHPVNMRSQISIFPVIQALYRFPVASSFPIGGETTFEKIAKAIDLNEQDTRRLLRLAMTYRIFHEPRKGVVAHTAMSKVIAETPFLPQYLGMVSEEVWRGQSRVIDAMIKWPGSGEPNETGLCLANGSDRSFFSEIHADPERGKRFDESMAFLHADGSFGRTLFLEMYDWGAVGDGLVVDVRGSQGQISVDLARRFPRMRFVSEDLPDVVARAIVPDDLVDRVKILAHDFFEEQPVKGADIYHFRCILHNWADKYALRILQNLRPALKRGAKIVVVDLCLPEPNAVSPYAQRRIRRFDLNMKASLNGMERDVDDWAYLFASADERFKFEGVTRSPKSQWAIMQAVWQGD